MGSNNWPMAFYPIPAADTRSHSTKSESDFGGPQPGANQGTSVFAAFSPNGSGLKENASNRPRPPTDIIKPCLVRGFGLAAVEKRFCPLSLSPFPFLLAPLFFADWHAMTGWV